MKPHEYYVYILASNNNRALYIGVTNSIKRRVYEHKAKVNKCFSSRYNINKLVYFEEHQHIKEAIAREKQLKNWKRSWKIDLLEKTNPGWIDLALNWYDEF